MRKLIIALVVLGILAGLAYGGRKGYRKWKVERAVAQAKEALAKDDYKNALLWIRKALQGNANHIEAVRLMGDSAELNKVPEALYWRNRLLELQPDVLTNRLMVARLGVISRRFDTAKKALEEARQDDKRTAEYQKAIAGLASAMGQYDEAEKSLLEAIRLEPENPVPQAALAVIRLGSTNIQKAQEGRLLLDRVSNNPIVRVEALRHLAADALRATNFLRTLSYTMDLVRETNSLFSDRLMHLGALRASGSGDFHPSLSSIQREIATNGVRIFELSHWMLSMVGPKETLQWLQDVSSEVRTNLPVTLSVADCLLASTNWVGLHEHVSNQHWGEFEYLRLAFSARAHREQDMTAVSKADWSKAFKEAKERLDRLIGLQRIAVHWNWSAEFEEVMWLIVNKYASETWAARALAAFLYASGKTRSLMTLFAQELKKAPENPELKNNLASIALLLDANEHRPHDLAREAYESHPENFTFASTYAFALFRRMETRKALEIMNQVKAEHLQIPIIAGYYGLMLTAVGEKEKGMVFLQLSEQGRALPEEREMFERARFGLQ